MPALAVSFPPPLSAGCHGIALGWDAEGGLQVTLVVSLLPSAVPGTAKPGASDPFLPRTFLQVA